MAGNLVIPRVRVTWDGKDLTLYPDSSEWSPSGELQPVVYDVSVEMQEEGQTPKATMKWNPVGPAYAAYEEFLEKSIDKPIIIEFFYEKGRNIKFEFVWAGHKVSYGLDMTVEITMATFLDGVINGPTRSVSQVVKDKPENWKNGTGRLFELYKASSSLASYTKQADKDTKKATYKHTYGEDVTLGEKLQQFHAANGNGVMLTNIGKAGVVIYTPYSWEKEPKIGRPGDTQTTWNPASRNGFFLGPSMIKALVRTSEWQKPQKSQTNTPSKVTKSEPKNRNQFEQQKGSSPQKREQEATKPTTAPIAPSRGKSTPDTASAKNPDVGKKQDAMKKERGSKLAVNSFMVPALVGVKPLDILFIPNFKGDYMEDWIVTSVQYQQTDGGVDISIQAARQFGLGDLMNKTVTEGWLDYAKSLKLVGEGSTLENWEEYAWPEAVRS
jgi:hypothetical protein